LIGPAAAVVTIRTRAARVRARPRDILFIGPPRGGGMSRKDEF
jgi:hypothetical protein